MNCTFESDNDVQKYIKENNLKYKSDDDILLVYSNFQTYNEEKTSINFKSVVFDQKKHKILSLTYKRPQYNDYELLGSFDKNALFFSESIEGTTVNLFFFKDKWNISTTSFIDAKNCYWKSCKSIYTLFSECIKLNNSSMDESMELFLSKHDTTKVYIYSLVHFENIHLIDYSYRFGNKYTKLCFNFSRNTMLNFKMDFEKPNDIDEFTNVFSNYYGISGHIGILDSLNKDQKSVLSIFDIQHEGVLAIDIENEVFIKLHTDKYLSYYVYDKIKNPGCVDHYISLYNLNMLSHHFDIFPEDKYFESEPILKIVNTIIKNITNDMYNLLDVLYDVGIVYLPIKEDTRHVYEKIGPFTKKLLYTIREKSKLLRLKINKTHVLHIIKGLHSTFILNVLNEVVENSNKDLFKGYFSRYNRRIRNILKYNPHERK